MIKLPLAVLPATVHEPPWIREPAPVNPAVHSREAQARRVQEPHAHYIVEYRATHPRDLAQVLRAPRLLVDLLWVLRLLHEGRAQRLRMALDAGRVSASRTRRLRAPSQARQRPSVHGKNGLRACRLPSAGISRKASCLPTVRNLCSSTSRRPSTPKAARQA